MPMFLKFSVVISAILTLVGSFLPWRREGDFVSNWVYGIQIFPLAKDNGGLLIVLLTLSVILLIFWLPSYVEKALEWGILLSTLLVFSVIFHIGKILILARNARGVVGVPTIQFGLIIVSIGAMLLLFSVIFIKSSTQNS